MELKEYFRSYSTSACLLDDLFTSAVPRICNMWIIWLNNMTEICKCTWSPATIPGRARGMRRSLFDIETLADEYAQVLQEYTITRNVTNACRRLGSKAMFYRRKHIAELRIVNRNLFEELLVRALADNQALQSFNSVCKNMLTGMPRVDYLRKEGKLLPWLNCSCTNIVFRISIHIVVFVVYPRVAKCL